MKRSILIMITALYGLHCFGQTDSTTGADSAKTAASLTLALTYSNNANYYGQEAEKSIPYVAAGATYKFRSGIYLSGLAYKLLNYPGTFISASNLGAGIAFNLSKKWSADANYSHTFYPSYSPLLQASNADNASVSLTYENWLTSKINVDYAFGKTNDDFVTLGTGKMITLGSISKKDVITLTPSFDVVAGTQHFYQTYITEKKLQDSLLGVLLPPVFGNPPSQQPVITTTTKFSLISYNFKLPVAYNRANYLFEVAYQLSVLSQDAETGPGKVNSFGSISFYYQF
jgi:hypothetical protein